MDSPTIVVARLDDKELQESINSMVTSFNKGLNDMKTHADSVVSAINASLKGIKGGSVSSGGVSDGGSTKRAQAYSEEGKQIEQNNDKLKELNTTLDGYAASLQKAANVKPASVNDVLNINNLREQLQYVERLRASQLKTYGELFAAPYDVQAQTLRDKIRGIEQGLTAVNKEQKQVTQAVEQSAAATDKQTQAAQRYTEEIRKQAQLIRQSKDWQETGQHRFAKNGEDFYVFREDTLTKRERKEIGSLETQLERLRDIDEVRLSVARQMSSTRQEEKNETQKYYEQEKEYLEQYKKSLAQVEKAAREAKEVLDEEKDYRGKISTEDEGLRLQELQQSLDKMRNAYSELDSTAKLSATGKALSSFINETSKEVDALRQKMDDARVSSIGMSSSLASLQLSLTRLRTTYSTMNDERRNSDTGQKLVTNIQRISRAIDMVQKQMSRPISLKEALSGSEKTLDDIAYKMQRLQMYKSGLDLKTQGYEIGEVNRKYDELRRTQLKYMSDSQKMTGINEALGRSWNYMKNRLAFYLTVGMGTHLIKELVRIRSEYEMNERALGVLISSAERGSQIFRELSQMALVSPYTLIELSGAAKQLTAYDVAAKDVVDTTRRLADMASAVGVPIERLTYALGQIKAYGYLNSRDNRMFLNAGIPLVRQLADYYSDLEGKMVSTADVYDRIKQKAVDYNDVMQVLNRMTDEGGRFFDFQGKMAETLKVQLANLTLAWNNMLNDIGQQTQGFAVNVFKVLRQLFVHWKDIDAAIWAFFHTLVVGAAGGAVYKFLDFLRQLKTGAVTAQSAIGGLQTSLIRFSKSAVWANIKGGGWFLLLSALSNAVWEVAFNFDSATEEMSKAVRESAENTYKDISEFLDGKELRRIIKSLREGTSEGQNEDNLSKAWEKVREEILLVSMAGEGYVQTLQEIEDVGERLQKGFGILEDVQTVAAVLKDMGDYGIAVQKDWSQFWNLWILPDGLFENLRDYGKELDDVIEKYGSLEALRSQVYGQNGQRLYGTDAAKDYDNLATAQQRFNENLQTTITSIHKIISLNEGWSSDVGKINELYAQVAHNLALQGSLSPEETFKLQLAMEKERAKDAKEAIQIRLADETAALSRALDEQSKMRIRSNIETLMAELQDFDKYNGESKVYWNDFTKYIKERRISEAREMFKGLSAEEIQNLDFSKGKYKEWVDDMVGGYAKSHKMSYDEAFQYLHNWVRSANKWSIFIPLTISTEDSKTEMQILEEADAAYQQAEKEIERLTTRKKELEALGASSVGTSKIDKEYAKTLKEITQAEKDLEDARAKGGHGKEKKSGKGGTKKDPVLDALKTEIKLVEQLQSEYDKLTKSGASREDALATIRGAFGNTIKQLNSQLRGYGLPELTTQLITGKDPNKALAHFKQTLQSLVDKGMMSLERSKEVEAIIEKLTISAKTYNLEKITKGLNSELDKLKEEYELAVELDADPTLGGIFADMFKLDVDQLPHTINEYAERVTDEINKGIKKRGDNFVLPTIPVTKDEMDALREMSEKGGLNAQSLEEIEKAYKELRGLRRDAAKDVSKMVGDYINEYGELSAKIQQIEIEKNDALTKLNEIYNTEELRQTQRYVDAKLAIEDGARRKAARAAFEALKKESDYERFFTAIDTFTKKDALEVKNKIKQGIISAFKDGGLTVNEFRKEIKALEDQFDKLTRPLSTWFAYVNGGFDKLIQRAKATGQELEVIGEKMSATGKLEDKDKNFLEQFGSIFKDGGGNSMNFSSLFSKFGGDITKLGKSVSSAGQGMQMGASNFAGAVSIVDMIIKNIHQTVQAIDSVIQELNSTRSEENKIGNAYYEGFKKFDNYVYSGWEKLKSGDVMGALGDTANSIISIFNMFEEAKNERINRQIKDSERRVRRLENAYKNLEFAIENAYGAGEVVARKNLIATKQLELAELKRQKKLEESRSSKRRDEDKIIELKGQIIDLENEIKQASDEIVNDLLGISSVGDAMEDLVSSMIDAFKKGEDYMKEYDESFSEMIDNMIVKSISSKVVGDALNKVWSELDKKTKERGEKYTKPIFETGQGLTAAQKGIEEAQQSYLNWLKVWQDANTVLSTSGHSPVGKENARQDMIVAEQKMREFATILNVFGMQLPTLQDTFEKLSAEQKEAMRLTPEDVQDVRDTAQKEKARVKEIFDSFMEAYGITFGQDKEGANLSALQQGIQAITEDTAGALEAITSGMYQQVTLQSTIMTQIRDVIIGFDPEVSMGIQSQMLLQLQQSYQVQMSIESILQGVLNPSGRAFAVEIIS